MDADQVLAGVLAVQNALSVLATLQITGYLWPQQANVQDGQAFDYIVVGAGTAGCVVAGRLAEDRNSSVLLIEAGGDPPLESLTPNLFTFLTKTKYDWNYTSADNPWLEGSNINDTINLTSGKVFGGSGSINGMIYVRGNPHDFESWAELLNDSNWNWDSVLSTYKKMEGLQDPEVLASATGTLHGTQGPVMITRQPYDDLKPYFDAFKEIGKDVRLDINGNDTLGYTESMYTIADGVRQNSAYTHISPKKYYPNLYVLKNTLVTRIMFDGNKNAEAVQILSDNNETKVVKANREIIISAGVYNSPKLLMLSGLGPREHLQSFDIDVVVDLPVGKNFQDQTGVVLAHKIPIAKSGPQKPWEFPSHMFAGYISINKDQTYPDYQVLNLAMPNNPFAPFVFCSFFLGLDKGFSEKLTEAGVNTLVTVLYHMHPKSRGEVLLRSSNPLDPPLIYLGSYTEEEDLDEMVSYIEDFILINNSSYFKNVGAALVYLDLPGCPDIQKGSKEYWRCYARSLMISSYHYGSTCSMGSVLDSRLRVLGVQNLRVVDASVMPILPSGNTNGVTTMIGEKASEMIKEDNAVHE